MKVHHIGYAVTEIEKAAKSFQDLGFSIGGMTEDKPRKVVIAFARNGDAVIELIAPLEKGSPVDSVLEKNGAAPYHICYEVERMEDACMELKGLGWSILRKPSPAPALDGAKVAFLYNEAVGIIELIEMTRI